MKLTALLKQIPPLPWLLVTATDGDKWIGTGEGDDRIITLEGKRGQIKCKTHSEMRGRHHRFMEDY